MSNVWFTSDLHLGHAFVSRLRGFGTTEEHDSTVVGNILDSVRKGDQLWILGDISSGSGSGESYALARLQRVFREIRGVHLIAGNHDSCHPMHREAHRQQASFMVGGFQSVQPFARRKVNGRMVLLSHFPYDRDRDESRYSQYRLRNEGRWLLHGHTHGTEQVTYVVDKWEGRIDEDGGWFERRLPDTREIHVGLDAWDFKPVSLNTIEHLMQEADDE